MKKKLNNIKNKIKEYKKSFFTINQKELNSTSKLLMILFFIVSLIILNQGIDMNIQQAEKPSVKYGYQCIKFANKSNSESNVGLNPFKNQITIQDFKKNKYSRYYKNETKDFGTSEICKEVKKKYLDIINNVKIQSEIDQINIISNKIQNLKFKKQRIEKRYSDMLLEKISNQKKENSILKTNASNAKKELEKYNEQQKKLQILLEKKKNIMNYPEIREFQLLMDKKSKQIIEEYNRAKKWYILKRSGQVLGFLIPIWIMFFWMFRKLEQKRKYIFAHLSFYVANAAALLTLLEIIHIIYVIIPKVFLQKIINFLISLNLGIIINIVGILFLLVMFGLIIKRIQNNEEKNAKKTEKKILNVRYSKCWNCSAPMKGGEENKYCYNCGEKQWGECKNCGRNILLFTKFCPKCGAKNIDDAK